MNKGLSSNAVTRLRTVFCKYPSLERVILFGSRAKGVQKKGSDVDIAVKGLNDRDLVHLSMRLNEEIDLPFFFDVIDVDSISNQDLLDHIERVGVVIFARKSEVGDQKSDVCGTVSGKW